MLVADDDPRFRETIAEVLGEDTRVRVVGFAANGEEALVQATLLHPHVVTMDVDMPVLDGVEATRRFASSLPSVRVVVVSGSGHSERAQRALAAGAAAYVRKSHLADELLEAVLSAVTASDEGV